MTDLNEALAYNMFDGDFGSSTDRCLSDKIVIFRRGGKCHECGQDVVPGTQGRSSAWVWDGDGLMSYRVCHECTEAQALSWTDDGAAIDARYRLRKFP